jgi:hypothetical protein
LNEESGQLRFEAGAVGNLVQRMRLALSGGPEFIDVLGNDSHPLGLEVEVNGMNKRRFGELFEITNNRFEVIYARRPGWQRNGKSQVQLDLAWGGFPNLPRWHQNVISSPIFGRWQVT